VVRRFRGCMGATVAPLASGKARAAVDMSIPTRLATPPEASGARSLRVATLTD